MFPSSIGHHRINDMNRRSFFAASVAGLTGGFVPGVRLASAAPATDRQVQVGCVTYNLLKHMDMETIIKTLEGAGLAAVELRAAPKHGVEPAIGPDERAKVRERVQRSGRRRRRLRSSAGNVSCSVF